MSCINLYMEMEEVNDIFAVNSWNVFDGSRYKYFAKDIEKKTLCGHSTFGDVDCMLQLALTTSTEAAASLLQAICL